VPKGKKKNLAGGNGSSNRVPASQAQGPVFKPQYLQKKKKKKVEYSPDKVVHACNPSLRRQR
jgi:hypothetical protein